MRRGVRLLFGAGGMLLPARAEAHTTLPGAGDFLNGLAHPALTPAHVLVLLSLGLWLGQMRPLRLGPPALTFTVAAGVALLLSTVLRMPSNLQAALAALSCVLALLVICESRPRMRWRNSVAGVAAFALGCDSSADAPGMNVSVVLAGTWLGVTLLVVNIAWYSSLLPNRPWARLGVRVLGSWLAAISFLVLAFALRR